LAIRVLNQFFWLRFPDPFFSPPGYVSNEIVKNGVKKEKKDDK
jgi:hypothetical protein